jgi:hypothetical protein
MSLLSSTPMVRRIGFEIGRFFDLTLDLALDVEGYHSHEREQSEQTVRSGTPTPSSTPARTRSPTPPGNYIIFSLHASADNSQ